MHVTTRLSHDEQDELVAAVQAGFVVDRKINPETGRLRKVVVARPDATARKVRAGDTARATLMAAAAASALHRNNGRDYPLDRDEVEVLAWSVCDVAAAEHRPGPAAVLTLVHEIVERRFADLSAARLRADRAGTLVEFVGTGALGEDDSWGEKWERAAFESGLVAHDVEVDALAERDEVVRVWRAVAERLSAGPNATPFAVEKARRAQMIAAAFAEAEVLGEPEPSYAALAAKASCSVMQARTSTAVVRETKDAYLTEVAAKERVNVA